MASPITPPRTKSFHSSSCKVVEGEPECFEKAVKQMNLDPSQCLLLHQRLLLPLGREWREAEPVEGGEAGGGRAGSSSSAGGGAGRGGTHQKCSGACVQPYVCVCVRG